ncbi:Glycosyl transferase family 2 [Devosia crocina]|uniref:Glycosyl transferase family 2 n=1 Tax=Devosia crocina TaxID=429728 RepID=A0A1I7MZ86_9HYPH|nr:glycosyltransferase [Devosia crocina]SFV27714.1 Glycosyl transferase family 2 [Devosia crocina]
MISVIIPHLNQPEALATGLAALAAQERVSRPFEIIVVDNGSHAMPEEICARYDNVTLLHQPVPGPGPARNLGATQAKGDILAFIDADCVAAPGWLAAIEDHFESAPDDALIGGDVRILQRNPQRPTMIEAYESVFAFRMKKYIEERGFTGGGNLAVRTWVFRKVGDFLGINIAEDTEWGLRASSMGYRVRYEPTMVVYHPARRNFAELATKWDRHIAHDLDEIKRGVNWRSRWTLRALAVLASPLAEIPRITVSDRLRGVRARGLAMVGVVCIRLYRGTSMLAAAMGNENARTAARWNRS